MKLLWILVAASLIVSSAGAAVQIVDPVFREYEDGPAASKNAKHYPGDTIYLTFQIAGFQVEGEHKQVHLTYRMESRDPEGLLIVEPKKGEVKVELAQEDKDWTPKIRLEAPIPSAGIGGKYHILIAVADENGKNEAKLDVPFDVTGPVFTAVPKITAQDRQFLRREDDTALMADRVYHPGDTLWMRFTFAGYKFGPKNKLHIQYGLALKTAEGKVLFSQPTAADLEEDGFYPKRVAPAIFNLQLDKTIPRGEYTVLLIVRDLIGAETSEYPETFRVE